MRATRCPIVGMVTAFVLAAAGPVLAERSIMVGNGTVTSCTEPALQDALNDARLFGGGKIRFDCGAHPITITLPRFLGGYPPGRYSLVVPDRTTIDGGELITFERENDLDADGRRGVMFYVGTGTTAALIGVTLVGQHFVVGVLNEGELTVRRTITRSLGVGFINTATGSLVIRHSAVLEEDSKCGPGVSAVTNVGRLVVDHSAFANHCTEAAGGAISSIGSLAVRNSTFTKNAAGRGGGAIYATGDVTIDNCEFSGNDAFDSGAGGGAVALSGTAVVKNSTFSKNRAYFGGAVLSSATLTIRNSDIVENTATVVGGGLYLFGSDATIRNSTITRNVALCHFASCPEGAGGGIFLFGDVNLELVGHSSVTETTPDDIAPR
jgi:predicted outer membrane repeat protein